MLSVVMWLDRSARNDAIDQLLTLSLAGVVKYATPFYASLVQFPLRIFSSITTDHVSDRCHVSFAAAEFMRDSDSSGSHHNELRHIQLYRPVGCLKSDHDAVELRDSDQRNHCGASVLLAIHNVDDVMGPAVVANSETQHKEIDKLMIKIDGRDDNNRWEQTPSLESAWQLHVLERRSLGCLSTAFWVLRLV